MVRNGEVQLYVWTGAICRVTFFRVHWSLAALEWQDLFNYVGVLGILLLLVAARYIRDPGPVATTSGQDFKTFLGDVFGSLFHTARLTHIWAAAGFGALCFGVMLGLGVVWAPKLLMA